MEIFNDTHSIKTFLNSFLGKKIGFVPTMGALHQGHLSLIELARKSCDIVVVSIFVNKKQFNNPEDYAKYPNTLEQDIILLKQAKVDALFNPSTDEIYANNFKTSIIISDLTNELCGKTRPSHFDGVSLIVTKLFNIIKPTKAFFGEKDFQQLQIIRKLVEDLNFDIEIISGSTLRENDGLAMSSRNLRLTPKDRKIAANIYRNLNETRDKILHNINKNIDDILNEAAKDLIKNGFDKIDYLQICDEENLKPVTIFDQNIKSRLFIAAFINDVRLIDNISI